MYLGFSLFKQNSGVVGLLPISLKGLEQFKVNFLISSLWKKSLFFSRFSFKFWRDLHDLEYVPDCSALFIGWYYLTYWQYFLVSFLRKGVSPLWYHFACQSLFLALSSWKHDKLLLRTKLWTQGHQTYLPVVYSWVKHLVTCDTLSRLLYSL